MVSSTSHFTDFLSTKQLNHFTLLKNFHFMCFLTSTNEYIV